MTRPDPYREIAAENAYFIFTNGSGPSWRTLSPDERAGWYRLADDILQREKELTYKSVAERSRKRIVKRLEESRGVD